MNHGKPFKDGYGGPVSGKMLITFNLFFQAISALIGGFAAVLGSYIWLDNAFDQVNLEMTEIKVVVAGLQKRDDKRKNDLNEFKMELKMELKHDLKNELRSEFDRMIGDYSDKDWTVEDERRAWGVFWRWNEDVLSKLGILVPDIFSKNIYSEKFNRPRRDGEYPYDVKGSPKTNVLRYDGSH